MLLRSTTRSAVGARNISHARALKPDIAVGADKLMSSVKGHCMLTDEGPQVQLVSETSGSHQGITLEYELSSCVKCKCHIFRTFEKESQGGFTSWISPSTSQMCSASFGVQKSEAGFHCSRGNVFPDGLVEANQDTSDS